MLFEELTDRIVERFWERVDVRGDDECWEFKAFKNKNGYGVIRINTDHTILTHRLSCFLERGPPPDGNCAMHSCDNPPCCNPSHLRWGSLQDNIKDRDLKNRMATGEKNGKTNLTEEQVMAIRADQRSHRIIGIDYGIGKATVCHIKARTRWKYVN